MIRKHVKVEPARWYTHCDQLGILVWQDMPSGDRSPRWQDHEYFNGTELIRSPESEANYRAEWKGIMDYLSIVNQVNMVNIEFYLAGERDEGNPQNISDKDMEIVLNEEKLNYLGKIDIETQLSEFDISLVMSSHEGFSRILLESLYVGLYCIAYKIQGTEVMREFNNLELIELNQIDKFVKSIEKYEEIIDNSKNRQLIDEFYTSKVVASQFEKIYKELDVLN